MPQVTHLHPYRQAPPYESLDVPTLHNYWDDIPQTHLLADTMLRSEIATELMFHPEADATLRTAFKAHRIECDEELMSQGYQLGNVHATVGRVFAPLIIGMGKDYDSSRKMTLRRAKEVIGRCEDAFPRRPEIALGVASEIFFILAMNGANTAASPSLGREDSGHKQGGNNCSWDALVASIGNPPIPKGIYRTQIKHGHTDQEYNPDIAVAYINPHDKYHVPENEFFDFTRLLMVGNMPSHKSLHKLEGRIHHIHDALRRHGPSRIHKVADVCLAEAA